MCTKFAVLTLVQRKKLNQKSTSDILILNLENNSQVTFTCSKRSIETLEKGAKYAQS